MIPRGAAAVLVWLSAVAVQGQEREADDSVARLARRIADVDAAALAPLRGDAVLAVELALPEGVPDGAGLVTRLLGPIEERLAREGRFVTVDRWLGARDAQRTALRASRRGYGALVHLRLDVTGGFLRVEREVWAPGPPGLAGLFAPRARRVGTSTIRHRLDAHLRRHLGAAPRVTATTIVARAATLPGHGYVAVQAADLDGDGRLELVLARVDRVDVVRLEAGPRGAPRVEPVGSAAIAAIPAAASRARRPIGLAVTEGGALVMRTSHHAAPFEVRLRGEAVVLSPVEGPCAAELYPLPDGCAARVTGRDYFHADLGARAGAPAPPAAPSGFYARVAERIPAPDGSWRRVEAVVTPRGRLATRVDGASSGAAGYGAAIALADLDDDGLPELLLSSPEPFGAGDRLSLVRLRPDASAVAVWTSEPMEGSILVAGAGDLDGDGRVELFAAEEPPDGSGGPARLWVIR